MKADRQADRYHLVGGVVSLELLVVGELDVDRVVSEDGGDGGVVGHHGLSRLLRAHLDEGLHTQP